MSRCHQGRASDLSVDGTIELENLKDVLYVGRPVHGQQDATISLFKITPDGSEASRVNVKLGRSSVTTMEVVSGLQVGDKVILSDMSQLGQRGPYPAEITAFGAARRRFLNIFRFPQDGNAGYNVSVTGVVLVVRRGCLMTALARITLANRRIGTKLTFPAYTKDRERSPSACRVAASCC